MEESVAGAAAAAASTAEEGAPIPSENDVILGRSKLAKKHPGNSMFREIIRRNKVLYASCKKRSDKKMVIDSIVTAINLIGGRFVQKDANGEWFEIESEKAYEKVGQALREGRPQIVREQLSEGSVTQQRLSETTGTGELVGGDQNDSAPARAASTTNSSFSETPVDVANKNNAASTSSAAPPASPIHFPSGEATDMESEQLIRKWCHEQDEQQNSLMDGIVPQPLEISSLVLNRSSVHGLFWPPPPGSPTTTHDDASAHQRNSLISNETSNAPGLSSILYPSPKKNPYSSSLAHPPQRQLSPLVFPFSPFADSSPTILTRPNQESPAEEEIEDSKPSAAPLMPNLDLQQPVFSSGLEERGKRPSSFDDIMIGLHSEEKIESTATRDSVRNSLLVDDSLIGLASETSLRSNASSLNSSDDDQKPSPKKIKAE